MCLEERNNDQELFGDKKQGHYGAILVILVSLDSHANTASITVRGVSAWRSDAAQAARHTVVDLLIRIPRQKLAYSTEVRSHLFAAVTAILSKLAELLAQHAEHVFRSVSINFVVRNGVVMTQPTCEEFSTTSGLEFCFSMVVLAAQNIFRLVLHRIEKM